MSLHRDIVSPVCVHSVMLVWGGVCLEEEFYFGPGTKCWRVCSLHGN